MDSGLAAARRPGMTDYSSKSQYSLTTGLLKLTRSSLLVSLKPAF
jgi:hypothetical protein